MGLTKWALALGVLGLSFNLWGLEVQQTTIPYYGKLFYEQLKSGTKDDQLKAIMAKVLSESHQAIPGQLDEVRPSCQGKGCYQHTSVGYGRARVFLLGQFYLVKHGNDYAVREVYCQEEYDSSRFGSKKPGPSVVPDNNVVNVEHTWPQSKFTGRFPEDIQKADLHHLFPTDSQMNSSRSSHAFGEVGHDQTELKCRTARLGTSIKSRTLVFEPPKEHKGNVARALFYFSIRYNMPIDGEQEAFLKKWDKEDPVDEEEWNRNNEIYKLQGNRNPFIDHPEVVERISNF